MPGSTGSSARAPKSKSRAKNGRTGFIVVPGVRPAGGDSADQKRVVTPLQAVDDGASIIVIGRPITAADDPAGAARAIADSLKGKVE